jgi:competence protein ComEC
MKFSEYPFLRYALFFIGGILIYPYLRFLGLEVLVYMTSGLLLFYLMMVLINSFQPHYRYKLLFPVVAYLLLIGMGILFTFLKDAKNDPSHLLHLGEVEGYLAVVEDLDQKKPNTFANRLEVRAVKKEGKYLPATGEVIIYHQLQRNLKPGEVMWVQGNPSTIPPPYNPHEFDYGRFLANQQIFHSHFVGAKLTKVGAVNHRPINNFVLLLRASVLEKIDRYVTTAHSNQIAKALLLGQNKNLEKEVSEAYITAGTMHVLAVSGLHVGIIYGFFFLFIKPYQLPGRKRALYLSLIITIIWIYALITGMSPSVLRAATMFTLMALAQMKSRSPSIYNSLALSALILLVFDPFMLYSVGFQLSYMAVLGIVLLQPKIVEWWEPGNRIISYLWEITTVGIAAQLATFPISVHYFHVFPTYFILSNLIAIPGAFLVMACGIPFMVFSFIKPLAVILGGMVDFMLRIENWVMFSFQELPLAQIEQINLTPAEMVLFWTLIISLYLLAEENKKKYAYFSLTVFAGLIFINWAALWKDYHRNELYIYQIEKSIALDHFYRGKLYSKMEGIVPEDISYKIDPNRISKGTFEALELKYWEESQTRKFALPGGSILQFTGQGFEVAAPAVHSISRFSDGQWLVLDLTKDQEQEDSAFRIIFK